MIYPEKQLDRIEVKLEKMDEKLDLHLERISKLETNQGWITRGLLAILGIFSSIFTYYVKH